MSLINVISRRLLITCLLLSLMTLVGCAAKAPQPQKDPAAEAALLKEQQETLYRSELKEAVTGLNFDDQTSVDAAKARLQAMLQKWPDRAEVHANLGLISFKADDLDSAKEYFKKAIQLNPQHAPSLNFLGVLARQKGQFEEAENSYRQALESNPSYAPAMRNLAILLDLYQGKLQEALTLYEAYGAHLKEQGAEPEPRLSDWVFDIKQRIKRQGG